MYNEEVKQRYLGSLSKVSAVKMATSVFKTTEPFEEELNKDVCFFDDTEIKAILADMSVMGGGTTNKGPRIQALQNYVKWRAESGVKGVNLNILETKGDPTTKIRERMVKSPEHLEAVLNALFRPVLAKTVDVVYRSALWLCYAGLSRNDFENVKVSGIDLKNKTVTVGEDTYTLYDQSLDAMELCIGLEEFAMMHSFYNGKDKRFIQEDTLLRCSTGILTPKTLSTMINRRLTMQDRLGISIPRIKIETVIESGLFYRAYQDSLRGIDVDFINVARKDMEGKEYSTTYRTMERQIIDRSRKYKAEYDRWVEVFYN